MLPGDPLLASGLPAVCPLLADSYAALDHIEEAHAMIRKVRDLNPALAIKLIQDGVQYPFAVAVVPWLRKAGCRSDSIRS